MISGAVCHIFIDSDTEGITQYFVETGTKKQYLLNG